MSNNIVIVDRELAGGNIEGVYFGPKLWVIARSPTAVLVWVFGHSYSVNGFSKYAEPHLTLLDDRSPRFMHHPHYQNMTVGSRLKSGSLTADQLVKIGGALGIGMGDGHGLITAIDKKKTLIVDGGGGSLRPFGGYDYAEWKARGGGFIVYPEGVTERDATRHKLGWKP